MVRTGTSVMHATPREDGDAHSASITATIMEQAEERIRCIEINGINYFEFWNRMGRAVRYPADEFLATLIGLRANPQLEDDWFPAMPEKPEPVEPRHGPDPEDLPGPEES